MRLPRMSAEKSPRQRRSESEGRALAQNLQRSLGPPQPQKSCLPACQVPSPWSTAVYKPENYAGRGQPTDDTRRVPVDEAAQKDVATQWRTGRLISPGIVTSGPRETKTERHSVANYPKCCARLALTLFRQVVESSGELAGMYISLLGVDVHVRARACERCERENE